MVGVVLSRNGVIIETPLSYLHFKGAFCFVKIGGFISGTSYFSTFLRRWPKNRSSLHCVNVLHDSPPTGQG